MNYYRVRAICGHVGKNKSIIKSFYTVAIDGKAAALSVRKAPRVKHDYKYAIVDVIRISYEEYLEGLGNNEKDPYFNVSNKQEQKEKCGVMIELITNIERQQTYKKNKNERKLILYKGLEREWMYEKNYWC